jgi:hypothetical protein
VNSRIHLTRSPGPSGWTATTSTTRSPGPAWTTTSSRQIGREAQIHRAREVSPRNPESNDNVVHLLLLHNDNSGTT